MERATPDSTPRIKFDKDEVNKLLRPKRVPSVSPPKRVGSGTIIHRQVLHPQVGKQLHGGRCFRLQAHGDSLVSDGVCTQDTKPARNLRRARETLPETLPCVLRVCRQNARFTLEKFSVEEGTRRAHTQPQPRPQQHSTGRYHHNNTHNNITQHTNTIQTHHTLPLSLRREREERETSEIRKRKNRERSRDRAGFEESERHLRREREIIRKREREKEKVRMHICDSRNFMHIFLKYMSV